MIERSVYPEWLEADENVLAEDIADLESELYDSDEDFKKMLDEKCRLLRETPKLRAAFDDGEPQALTAEEVSTLARVIDLDRRMRSITDIAIFLYGRRNAYLFMKSVGLI